jgi:cholesterol oxidase
LFNKYNLRRRSFIKGTALAGIGFATGCKEDAPKLVPSGVNQYRKAVIIGSGFGGAVTALRLCQAGIETTILERGISWDTTDPNAETFSDALGSDNRSTWLNRTSAFPFGPPNCLTA